MPTAASPSTLLSMIASLCASKPSSTRFTNVFLSSWYHDGPTVYCNRLSGDVARRVAEKKHDGIGNILGLADAAERELRATRAEFFQCGVRERLGGFRHPGDNRIDANAERAELHRHGLGERDDTRL